MSWQQIPTISASMPFQMALDEILFRQEEKEPSSPILRFYYSSEPWTSLGFSYKESDLQNLPRNSSRRICRRLTGGGKVEHGSDLIFSVVSKKNADSSFASVGESYIKIHEAVKKGLELLGQEVRFYRCTENLPKGNDCFVYPIASDLAVGNSKIAGGSQKRSSGTLLHQESVAVPRGMNPSELEKGIRRGFEMIFGITFKDFQLYPELLAQAENLSKTSYPDLNAETKERQKVEVEAVINHGSFAKQAM